MTDRKNIETTKIEKEKKNETIWLYNRETSKQGKRKKEQLRTERERKSKGEKRRESEKGGGWG